MFQLLLALLACTPAILLVVTIFVCDIHVLSRQNTLKRNWAESGPQILELLGSINKNMDLLKDEERTTRQAVIELSIVQELARQPHLNMSAELIAHSTEILEQRKSAVTQRIELLRLLYSESSHLRPLIASIANESFLVLQGLPEMDCATLQNGNQRLLFLGDMLNQSQPTALYDGFVEPRICSSECHHAYLRFAEVHAGIHDPEDGRRKCRVESCCYNVQATCAHLCNKCSVATNQCAICGAATDQRNAFDFGRNK